MSQTEQQMIETLKAHGYSSTSVRRAVFHTLTQEESLTMAKLVKSLSGQIDRASIYRTVELFEQLDIVHRIQIGWKYRLELSDQFSPHHHHIHCTVCKRIVSLKEDSHIEQSIQHLAASAGFKLTAHQLELSGVCSNCRQQKK